MPTLYKGDVHPWPVILVFQVKGEISGISDLRMVLSDVEIETKKEVDCLIVSFRFSVLLGKTTF